jgi:ribosome-associated heat shock protein Hsp15
MRIDRFLHCIRLVKSRTLAQALIESGYVRIDGKRVEKPSEPVREGSIVALPLHDRTRVFKVLSLPSRRGPPAEARACYEEVSRGQALTGQAARLSERAEGATPV